MIICIMIYAIPCEIGLLRPFAESTHRLASQSILDMVPLILAAIADRGDLAAARGHRAACAGGRRVAHLLPAWRGKKAAG
jgi:hypothetical protein